MQARVKFLFKALAFAALIFNSAYARSAYAHDSSQDKVPAVNSAWKNGSIGVAHVIEMFEMETSCGQEALVIVTTDEDFEHISQRGISEDTPFFVDLVGYNDYRLSLRRVRDGHWVSGRVTRTAQQVYVIMQKHAKYWR